MALNERDKTLSQSQQDAINKATNDYNAAKAKGDKAGKQETLQEMTIAAKSVARCMKFRKVGLPRGLE